MPSFDYTPGALVLAGATFNPEPIRFSYTAGRLALAGGSYDIGIGASTDDRLPRLRRQVSYFEDGGTPTKQMQQHWQTFAERIEARFAALEAALDAQAMAAAAQQTALATSNELALVNSYIDPVGAGSASSAGTVTITAHTRRYGNGTSVSVNSGSVTGFSPGQYVTVYYVDAARAGGAVTYQGTTSAVSQTGSTHIVWQGAIPSAGAADAPGSGPTAPGYTPPDSTDYDPRLIGYDLQ